MIAKAAILRKLRVIIPISGSTRSKHRTKRNIRRLKNNSTQRRAP
jgi:hypothetical protein